MKIIEYEATNCSNLGSYKNTPNTLPLTWHRIYKVCESMNKIENETYLDILKKFGVSLDTVINVIMIDILDNYNHLNELIDSDDLTAYQMNSNYDQIADSIKSRLSKVIIEHIKQNPLEDPLQIDYLKDTKEFKRLIRYLSTRYKLIKGGERNA